MPPLTRWRGEQGDSSEMPCVGKAWDDDPCAHTRWELSAGACVGWDEKGWRLLVLSVSSWVDRGSPKRPPQHRLRSARILVHTCMLLCNAAGGCRKGIGIAEADAP